MIKETICTLVSGLMLAGNVSVIPKQFHDYKDKPTSNCSIEMVFGSYRHIHYFDTDNDGYFEFSTVFANPMLKKGDKPFLYGGDINKNGQIDKGESYIDINQNGINGDEVPVEEYLKKLEEEERKKMGT